MFHFAFFVVLINWSVIELVIFSLMDFCLSFFNVTEAPLTPSKWQINRSMECCIYYCISLYTIVFNYIYSSVKKTFLLQSNCFQLIELHDSDPISGWNEWVVKMGQLFFAFKMGHFDAGDHSGILNPYRNAKMGHPPLKKKNGPFSDYAMDYRS